MESKVQKIPFFTETKSKYLKHTVDQFTNPEIPNLGSNMTSSDTPIKSVSNGESEKEDLTKLSTFFPLAFM